MVFSLRVALYIHFASYYMLCLMTKKLYIQNKRDYLNW
jgi:hypothetical protein